MTTLKVWGCGGMYSYSAFFPCSLCVIGKLGEDNCEAALEAYRTTKHEEYFTNILFPKIDWSKRRL